MSTPSRDISSAIDSHCSRVSHGKSQNQVRADMEGCPLDQVHRSQHGRIVVPAIHAPQRVVIDRFHAEFQRDECLPADVVDHADLFFVHAVRPRSDREADDFRMIDRVGVELPQVFGFRVSVRERLEVDDELIRVEAFSDVGDAVADLIANRIGLDCGRRPKRAVVAVSASAGCDGSIAVRAGEARIDDDFVDAFAESFLQPAVVAAEAL